MNIRSWNKIEPPLAHIVYELKKNNENKLSHINKTSTAMKSNQYQLQL